MQILLQSILVLLFFFKRKEIYSVWGIRMAYTGMTWFKKSKQSVIGAYRAPKEPLELSRSGCKDKHRTPALPPVPRT